MALKIKEDGEWKATGSGGGGGGTIEVIDNLNSASTTSALSANQGKVLDEGKAEAVHTHKAGDIERLEGVAINAMLSRKEINYTLWPDDNADGQGHSGVVIVFEKNINMNFSDLWDKIQISVSYENYTYWPTVADLGGFATAEDRSQWATVISFGDIVGIGFDPVPGFRAWVTVTIDPILDDDRNNYYFKGPWHDKNPEDEEDFDRYSSFLVMKPS